MIVKMADGSERYVNQGLKIRLRVAHRIIQQAVIVLPEATDDLVLGMDFLIAVGAKFCCGNQEVALGQFPSSHPINPRCTILRQVTEEQQMEDFLKTELPKFDDIKGAIRENKTPTTTVEVRRFLGLTGFFRKFVEHYSIIARPLNKLLRANNGNTFMWGYDQQTGFETLIGRLTKAPILTLYDYRAMHEVHTDASTVGLAAVLLVTDCSAVASMKAKTPMVPRVARWWLKLAEFNIVYQHRAERKMQHVDALSRAPDPKTNVEDSVYVALLKVADDDWLFTMQWQDEKLREIIEVMNGVRKSEQETQLRKDYKLLNNRLYRQVGNGNLFVVPKLARAQVVRYCHDDMGHYGLEKTIKRINEH